jgi:thioester reductase-like protein
MRSIITEIEKRTNENPDKLLFAFLDSRARIKVSYTYREFEKRTKTIATYIHQKAEFSPGDRVLLAYPPGLEIICAFFACVRLGLIPVPVYPPSAQGLDSSVQKMDFIAQDCGAKAVLTDLSSYWSYQVNLSRNNPGIAALRWLTSDDAETNRADDFPVIHNEIVFLQYTSGSTDHPKGVMVTHENILSNFTNVVDHLPVGVSWLPQYHDMGLIGYYLFFAIKGGTTYGFSPADFIQRPALWLEAITKYKGTATSAPDFAFAYCLQEGKITDNVLETLDLSSLRFLMTAAEPIRPDVYYSFLEKFKPAGLKPEAFFGAYGLAEFTLAVSNYGKTSIYADTGSLKNGQVLIKNPDEITTPFTSLMSCGKPLPDTVLKIVSTDAHHIELPERQVGEIWLKGQSKCKGYWNRPELTKKIFGAELKGDTDQWLRTGDLGFLHGGELYLCGRIKDLIIIRGLNYYPQDIEAIIEQDPLIRSNCTVAFSNADNDGEKLVVVAGLKNLRKVPNAGEIQVRINRYFGINASEIVFVPARTISKTSSGKIRRNETKQAYKKEQLEIISRVIFDGPANDPDPNEFKAAIQKKNGPFPDYQNLLNYYKLNGNESAALGNAGLDSMKIAEFGHDLKTYLEKKGLDDLSSEVDLKLLQRIAVSELFAILNDLDSASRFARFKFRKAFSGIRKNFEKSELSLMSRDAVLPGITDAVRKLPAPINQGAILVTGGTGFFGPFLLNSLLEQTNADIHVLIRSTSTAEATIRLRESFNTIHPSPEALIAFARRIKPVCGDLSRPGFGLPEDQWHFLCNTIATIYHNGACVNYLLDYEAMRPVNVNGTKMVIDFALRSRLKTLNYISTTFIFGWSVKETLFETDSNAEKQFLDFGYSQSKWTADQLVQQAINQGMPARVFRPALISPSINGNGYNFDIAMRLLTFMLRHGIGTNAQNQVSFTPADVAANNIVAISNQDASLRKTFHVTRDEFASMGDVTDLLSIIAGKSFRNYDLRSFVPEVVSRCTKDDLLFPLLNFLVRSVDNISAMEFKRYDNSNYRKFRRLSAWGKEDPPLADVVKGIFLFMKNNRAIAERHERETVSASASQTI